MHCSRCATVSDQPTRASPGAGSTDSAGYHDIKRPVDHFYLAAYQYLREQAGQAKARKAAEKTGGGA